MDVVVKLSNDFAVAARVEALGNDDSIVVSEVLEILWEM